MKAIINGRTYNTDTADYVCQLNNDERYSDPSEPYWHLTFLYRSPKGTFFIAGEGGPSSMWAVEVRGGKRGGSGLRVVTVDEARAFMESAGCTADDFEEFGLPLEEG